MKYLILQSEEKFELLLSNLISTIGTLLESISFTLFLFTHEVKTCDFLTSNINFLRTFIQNMSLNIF